MTRTSIRLFAGGALLAVAVAACGGSSSGGSPSSGSSPSSGGANTASAPGITATTVTIGSHQPLTGVAAPGYDEIAPASNAYFQWVNAHGGINGRKIVYKYLDDAYNPAQTVTVVHKLVLQDKVFAIFNGLGTPTHQQVVAYLNSQKIPDLFVASGCLCWNMPSTQPETFGWQPDYTIEGKILGQYITQKFKGQKVAVFAQGDDFGHNGVKGLQDEVPSSQIATIQYYDPTNTNVAPQVQKLAQSGAKIVVSFTVPAFTALLQLTALQLKYQPQLVVSNVGSDPKTLAGLLTSFSKGKAPGSKLIQGIITDGYLSSPADTSNSWIQLFQQVHQQYIPKLPFDGNVEYGMAAAYTFVQALKAAGQNPTRASIVSAIQSSHFTGPGLVPFGFSSSSHAGYTGVQIGVIKGSAIHLLGQPMTTDDGSGAITPFTTQQPAAPANGIPSN
ncbi:MAG TPA: ABC transporter substrate-binding protein [Mycobacteriales bacterium]|jgi:ABC-type branched-subunit amino acid transport system substrate-binding protein|nr:ABC transporter substrate-binding protein [Mycobacteriales bacterium]